MNDASLHVPPEGAPWSTEPPFIRRQAIEEINQLLLKDPLFRTVLQAMMGSLGFASFTDMPDAEVRAMRAELRMIEQQLDESILDEMSESRGVRPPE